MIITTKNGDMVDTIQIIEEEAQYHLRQFIKYMKQLGRYY